MIKSKTRRKDPKKRLLIEVVDHAAPIRTYSFAKASPKASALWAYDRNCGWSPSDFSYGSRVEAWFKCPRGPDHFYQVALWVISGAERQGVENLRCGFCIGERVSVTNRLSELNPEVAKEWMYRKNGCRPDDVRFGSMKLAWWRCQKGHTWQSTIANRTGNNSGCPKCNRGAPTDLREFPYVLAEFDFKKNKGIDPHALPVGLKVHWKCELDPTHKWKSGFYRTDGQRCPYCTNKKASPDNNLKVQHPELAKQWHPTKNTKKPTEVTPGSSYRAWWKCNKGPDHEWSVKVNDRVSSSTGCPFCQNRKTSVTNVITTRAPAIAKEWHPTKNGKATPDQERIHSTIERWWKCSRCSRSWQAPALRRFALGHGCPNCKKN